MKVTNNRKRTVIFFSAIVVLIVVSLVIGTTVYAVKSQRKVHKKESGYIINNSFDESDASNPKSLDYDIKMDSKETDNGKIISEQEIGYEGEKPSDMVADQQIVSSISEAKKLVPFNFSEIAVPNMELDEIYVYTPDNSGENNYIVILLYSGGKQNLTITYRYFQSEKWSYETDFGNEYVSSRKYKNKDGIDFEIIEGLNKEKNIKFYEAACASQHMLVLINAENVTSKELDKVMDYIEIDLIGSAL